MASIATAVIGWFAGPAFNTILGKVWSSMDDCYKLKEEARLLIASTGTKLSLIHNALEGCPNAYANKNISNLLEKLQLQIIHIENLVDTIKVESAEKKKSKEKRKKNDIAGEDDFSNETDINQLKVANLRLDLYSDELRKIMGGSWMEKPATDGAEFVAPLEKVVIGREAEAQRLCDILLSGSRGHANPRLICMVGEPGVGKSSLARHIFDSPIIRAFFDLRGWIVKPTLASMSENLVSAFITEGCKFNSEPEKELLVHAQISGVIKMRRFLIVFDDTPDNIDDIWTMLSPTFSAAGPESAVLVITKSEDVAERIGELVGEDDRLMLHPLPQSSMSRILEHHSSIGLENNELKQMGEKICSRLRGLPLLAVLVGRLLSKNLSKDYWQSITDSFWWLEYETHKHPCLAAMAVVFEHIAIPLQRCLGYCSIFPEGHFFLKSKLKIMWSENFSYGDSIQLHKDGLFNSLESMGLLEQYKHDVYTMNELVRSAVVLINMVRLYGISYEDSFRSYKEQRHVADVRSYNKEQRHVAIDAADVYLYCDSSKKCKWRTLIFLDGRTTSRVDERLANILSHTNGLRVLDLSTIRLGARSPPKNIQDLILLGVLDLSFTKISTCPEFLCELTRLRFLGLKGCKFSQLPNKLSRLRNLQHFFAEPDTYAMIKHVGKLTALVDLQLFRVKREDGYNITELGSLGHISGTVKIENLEVVSSATEAKAAELFKKENIRRLVLKWDPIAPQIHNSEVLEMMEQPGNLEELHISGYSAPCFPTWVGQGPSSQKLRCVEIVDCIQLDRLPQFGLLPSLNVLLLKHLPAITEITSAFYGSDPEVFCSLKELILHDMPSLGKWEVLMPNQLIPKLSKVQIQQCKRLGQIPLISFKAPILDLIISDCPLLLESTGSCLVGLESVKHLTIENSRDMKSLPWSFLSNLELLRIRNCTSLSLDGREILHNIKRIICDRTSAGFFEMISYGKSGTMHDNIAPATTVEENDIELYSEKLSSGSAGSDCKVIDQSHVPVGFQDLPRSTHSVYKSDYALITPESHAFCSLPKWNHTSGAYLVIPKIGANFAMYFAKMKGASKSAPPTEDVERFVFVLKGSISLSMGNGTTHSLPVDSYAYIPANMEHSVVSNEPTVLIIFEKRYIAIEGHQPDLIVSSADKQPVLETPGEVFRTRKLLPTSMPYDFNILIMEFEPGECHKVQEVHYSQHGLLLLEGQGMYQFGKEVHWVQAGDAIWTAPFVPHWYAALGKTRTRYLMYEDVNRDPLLL